MLEYLFENQFLYLDTVGFFNIKKIQFACGLTKETSLLSSVQN